MKMDQAQVVKLDKLQRRRRSSVLELEATTMLGHYREDLSDFFATQAEKMVQLQEERRDCESQSKPINSNDPQKYLRYVKIFLKSGGDLVFFSILAITLALLSFTIDVLVRKFYEMRSFLTTKLTDNFYINYALWIFFTLFMVQISASITQIFSPCAAGSGIPEIKVILRGVVLKEYLTIKTLIAKIFGLLFALGSCLPLGKEGPIVHLSSVVANQFMKLFSNISDPHQYEARFAEVLAVACSIGVAVTFASPVGGVLFSIEIVSVFFSVTSYWHGFFAATVGALFWRLLSVWFEYNENITHVFKTDFRLENPYETLEIVTFAFLGVFCGFSAFLFVKLNTIFVQLMRKKSFLTNYLNKHPILYALLVASIVSFVSFPGTFGKYYASWLNSEESIHELYTNFTWSYQTNNLSTEQLKIISNWSTDETSVFINLFLFFTMNIITLAICATIPIPLGLIAPSLKIGAGLGRFYGELISYFLPNGISPIDGLNRTIYPILPGTYAVAGSAAFAGSNTGAMSTGVMAFEMTGQVTHLLPVIVSILTATMTASLLGPSIYDSLIILKKLPYLPSILSSSFAGNQIFVEDFMNKDIQFVWAKCTYRYIRHLLSLNKKFRFYPYVKSDKNRILLGTVERTELQFLLDDYLRKQKSKLTKQNSISVILEEDENEDYESYEQTSKEMSAIEKINFEEMQLDNMVDFTNCPIDPAPFQLMEGSSLPKVHNLFSLLGLQQAYVTSLGTLVGVVSLKELRKAIEAMNSGTLPRKRKKLQSQKNGDTENN